MRISDSGSFGGSRSAMLPAMRKLDTAHKRLASGKRITTAADDAAGLAISEKLSAQVRSLEQASRNIDHGSALTRIADGALSSQGDNLVRMRELAMQSANGTLSDSDRAAIQSEFSALREEVDRVGASTEFNGQQLLAGEEISIQVGPNAGGENAITIATPTVSSSALGLDSIDLSSADGARDALASIDAASETLSAARGSIGAAENRMTYAQQNVGSSIENSAAARSRIADADIGEESSSASTAALRLKASLAMQKTAQSLPGLLLDKLG